MTRLRLALMFVVYTIISAGIVFAQQGGTVRGQIVDTTERQNPIEGVEVVIVAQDGTEFTTKTDANGDYERSGIPAGRYLISIYKDGYGDRLGKPVTIVNGGDHYVPLKMTKKNTIMDFFQGSVPMFWVLILCVVIVILILVRTK
ncbi:MAG: carboxypeptidase-like regulatory domain-containing protein [Candidatus Poribacteria bacterium]|nr:carboxypeptidase-like regulatory domain-containing protein [Candidatus Poribacteria bacterium]